MSDPQRLLDGTSDPVALRLLSGALHEPPPPDLLARTLHAVGAAAPVGAAAGGVAAKVTAIAATKVAGGGILGAVAVGALAGVLAVGGFALVTTSRAQPPGLTDVAASAITAVASPREAPTATVRVEPAPTTTAPSTVALPSARAPVTIAAELELLDEVRQALRDGDPARSRELLNRYAREVPHGQLGREAAMLRAEADAAIEAGKTIP